MVQYYDKLLIAIPVLIFFGLVTSAHPAVELYQGIAGGSLAATLVLFEAIYRNPPVEPEVTTAGAAGIVTLGWIVTLWTVL